MEFRPDEIAGARPWRLAAFTTYALSLSFFESVVLDRLVRGRTDEVLLIADAEGIRSALSEQGVQGAGRDYEIEPVFLGNGAFHAKLSLFDGGGDDIHLVVSSGNLTFSGWGRNLELADHLHPSFAADAFLDAASFFEGLASLSHAHAVPGRCLDIAERLSRAAMAGGGDGSVRLLHGFGEPIGDRIASLCDTLGGAVRLTAAAPFWDGGQAAARLCGSLGLEAIHVHAHPGGTVQGSAGDCWPRRSSAEVVPVLVSSFAGDARALHAKAFEIVCRNGRVLVSGSANGTSAALYGENVEACVARVVRDPSASWVLEPANPLAEPARSADDDDEETFRLPGVLRAQVSGDAVSGLVLSPRVAGDALLSRVTADGNELLCSISVGEGGSFAATVPGLEARALRGGRLVLRLDGDGWTAEGFASLSAVTGLRRIAGKAAPSLLSVLMGTETPEDVIALMEWAHDNADALSAARPSGSGGSGTGAGRHADAALAPSGLWNAALPAGGAGNGGDHGRNAAWMRFVDSLVSALRQSSGSIGDDDDADDGPTDGRRPVAGDVVQRRDAAAGVVDRVIEALLPKGAGGRAGMLALDLARYACRLGDSVTPGMAREWLRKGVEALVRDAVPEGSHLPACEAALLLTDLALDADSARHARSRLMMMGADFAGPAPDGSWARPFADRMRLAGSIEEAWNAACQARTWREEARFYARALEAGLPASGYEAFLDKAGQDAELLTQAFISEQARRRVKLISAMSPTCCNMQLPKLEISRFRQYGVARAANCCQKVLVCVEALDG